MAASRTSKKKEKNSLKLKLFQYLPKYRLSLSPSTRLKNNHTICPSESSFMFPTPYRYAKIHTKLRGRVNHLSGELL